MFEMENMGEGKALAQMNVHRDGKKWIQFAKCFYMGRWIYQEGINWKEHARKLSEPCKAEVGVKKMDDGGNMSGI